jgi:hypothetical protein
MAVGARLLSSHSSPHICVDGGGDVMDEPRVPLLVRLQVCRKCMTVWAFQMGGSQVLGLLHVSHLLEQNEVSTVART